VHNTKQNKNFPIPRASGSELGAKISKNQKIFSHLWSVFGICDSVFTLMRCLFSHYVMSKLFYNAIYLFIAHVCKSRNIARAIFFDDNYMY